MKRLFFASAALFHLSACAEPDEVDDRPPRPPRDDTASEGDTDTDTDTDADTDSDADTDLTDVQLLCQEWNQVRAGLDYGTWTGSVAGCDAGSYSRGGIDSTLELVNLYRSWAGLPSVSDSDSRNAAAQECALMQHAAGYLNHYPQPSAPCYSEGGASAAGQSNLSATDSVEAVDLYMEDPGNSTTLGHRRWILSNGLGPIGVGSTDSYSCMWVLYGSGSGSNRWTAWPAPGLFPMQALDASWSSVDDNGWSVQSDSINLNNAQVSVSVGEVNKPVSVTSLLANYGSSYAISIIPQGWESQAGVTYSVDITGSSENISYEVTIVDCDRS
jgi:hypothetical protein